LQREGILPLAELEAIEVGPSQVIEFMSLSKCARIPPSSAGGMNGLPSLLGGEG